MEENPIAHEYSKDYYFDPAGASESPEEAVDKLKAVVYSGDFTTDAKAYLKSVGQGLHALDQGDEAKARALLQQSLDGYRSQQKPTDYYEAELLQEEIKALEQILK